MKPKPSKKVLGARNKTFKEANVEESSPATAWISNNQSINQSIQQSIKRCSINYCVMQCWRWHRTMALCRRRRRCRRRCLAYICDYIRYVCYRINLNTWHCYMTRVPLVPSPVMRWSFHYSVKARHYAHQYHFVSPHHHHHIYTSQHEHSMAGCLICNYHD